MNQFNIIKIYTIFTQQQDTNSIQVPINSKPGDMELKLFFILRQRHSNYYNKGTCRKWCTKLDTLLLAWFHG